jgi:hypothetical protein
MHLVGMALYVLWPDSVRLIDFLILNEPVYARRFISVFSKPWLNLARTIVKSIFILGLMIYTFIQIKGYQKEFGEHAPKPPLYGIYEVETFHPCVRIRLAGTSLSSVTKTVRQCAWSMTAYGALILR